jgi:hypothetical protein
MIEQVVDPHRTGALVSGYMPPLPTDRQLLDVSRDK